MNEQLNELRKSKEELAGRLLDGFEMMTKNPMAVQTKLLMELLETNKDTEYGKKYGFSEIKSIEEYQQKLPLTEYDDYAEYIDRMVNNSERNLISSNDPVWYNKTSGTVGVPKKIPYSERTKGWFDRYSLLYQSGLLFRHLGEEYYGGRVLNLIRCGNNIKRLPDGIPFGPISEAGMQRFRENWSMFFPNPAESVFAGKGTDVRYLSARYSLCDKELNNITCTFTGFLMDFCRYVEKHWEIIVNDIEKGTIDESVELPEELRASLTEGLEPMPERAAELRSIFEKGFDTPFMPLVWPKLRYVVGGASAGFARYTNEVRERYLGMDVAFYYRGVSASEGIFSVPIDIAAHESSLIPDSLFYEFIPVDEEDAVPVTMDKLEVGKKYELVISNHSGFYRYRMKDVLLVTGFHNATPMVEFQYRIDKTVSLMGEKTTEMALRVAAENTAKECGFLLVDNSVYPDTDELRYVYIMEIDRVPKELTEDQIRSCLEKNLALVNPSYGDKVKNGLIKPAGLLFSQPETYALYKDMMLMKGNSIAQLKPVTVIGNEMQRKFFFALTGDYEEIKSLTAK